MKVYYGVKNSSMSIGTEYYIMSVEHKEMYVFDMFGTLSRVNGAVSECNYWKEVDCISFVGIGSNSCEILVINERNSVKTELNMSLLDSIKPIREHGRYIGNMFNVSHEDEQGKFNQILFIFPLGYCNYSFIGSLFPNRKWKPL